MQISLTDYSINKYRLIIFIFLFSYYLFPDSEEGSLREVFVFSVESLHQERYGTQYPLTYKFVMPDQVKIVSVGKWSGNLNEWIPVKKKNAQQFFNAAEVFRYEPSTGEIFISVAFNENSSMLSIAITYQTINKQVKLKFVEITPHYDDRKAVITATMDDYSPGSQVAELPAFNSALEFQKHKIWLTVGIVTQHSDSINFSDISTWVDLQSLLNGGFIEPASHSRTHAHFIFDDVNYHSEIEGSKEDIINNLDLPVLFTSGDKEYVYTWIAPFGQWDSITEDMLAELNYLVNRCYLCNSFHLIDLNTRVGIFSPVKYSIEMGQTSWDSDATDSIKELNGKFDYAYNNGLVYHLVVHPQSVDWTQQYPHLHLKYIADRYDVWYVSLGHLYLYQLTKDAITHKNPKN